MDEQEQFLPEALAIQESPPSPVGHALIWLLLGLFSIAVGWAMFGEVDIVVTASGRVIPGGNVKVVQVAEAGSVRAILVAEGTRVAAGATLVELDSTYADADGTQVARRLHHVVSQLEWRRALEQWLATAQRTGTHPDQATYSGSPDGGFDNALYRQHRSQIETSLVSLDRELDSISAQIATVRAERGRAVATLQILTERVSAYQALVEKQYGARAQYLEMLQQQTQLQMSIPIFVSRQTQLKQTAAGVSATRRETLIEARRENLLELDRLQAERLFLAEDDNKARKHQSYQSITAPVTGTVQELSVHTVGAVVAPGQQLMKLVPENSTIEVEAKLLNKDVGFVTEGQRAEIKIDTFNFTKYGLIGARVTNISNDAVKDERLGWVFTMQLALDDDSITVEHKEVPISPGMSITAELKTGKRRLLEFFLSPLLRVRQESVRER